MAPAVNKLQRLDNEFDFANSTAPKFNVPVQFVGRQSIAFYSSLDRCYFVEQIRSRTSGVDERLMLTEKFVGQLAITCDSTRFDQCNSLPSFAKTGIVIFHAFE